MNIALSLVLLLCVVRLWVMPMGSSFWVDEMGTAFVVHHGGTHPSFAVAPQVPYSIYYWLPKAMDAWFGISEIAYRMPSFLAMGGALFVIVRIVMRTIHPAAAWLVVFACFGMRGINYQAHDARPYALGVLISSLAVLFLVRWFESERWRDLLLFVIFAALLWRVHLIFWPFYLVFSIYALVQLIVSRNKKLWIWTGAAFGLTAILLLPVVFDALALLREAKSHVIVDLPRWRDLRQTLKFGLILSCGVGALVLARLLRAPYEKLRFTPAAIALIVGWWLSQPLGLFAFSWLTGNSVFVARYLNIALPGAALVAAAVGAYFLPVRYLKPGALILGIGVLISLGQWKEKWPLHHNSDWRLASRKLADLHLPPDTPIVCPSPFIEAKPPVWRPDYPLPGFLYSHLDVYPPPGKPYLFPFESSPEAVRYAASLAEGELLRAGRFAIYGGDRNVWRWRDWFANRPELDGWKHYGIGKFGDVDVVVFERSAN